MSAYIFLSVQCVVTPQPIQNVYIQLQKHRSENEQQKGQGLGGMSDPGSVRNHVRQTIAISTCHCQKVIEQLNT